jgi:hypothetical protein
VSRRRLPLESDANWWLIEAALKHRSELTGSELAKQDFNQSLKSGRLRAMVRRADGSRELLEASAWEDLHIAELIRVNPKPTKRGHLILRLERMAVWSRKLGGRPRWQWFFVWKPDYENIFGDKTEKPKPPAQTREMPGKGGRPLKHDWVALALEASWLFRHYRKLTRHAVVAKLERWLLDRNKEVPAKSDLQTLVDQVYEHVERRDKGT